MQKNLANSKQTLTPLADTSHVSYGFRNISLFPGQLSLSVACAWLASWLLTGWLVARCWLAGWWVAGWLACYWLAGWLLAGWLAAGRLGGCWCLWGCWLAGRMVAGVAGVAGVTRGDSMGFDKQQQQLKTQNCIHS